jgi:replication factor A2
MREFASMRLWQPTDHFYRTLPHPDADFKIDGSEVTQVCLMFQRSTPHLFKHQAHKQQLSFVGQIHTVSSQATNTTFKIDDGTGLVDVKQWIDSDADPETAKALPSEGQYIHVWGRLKEFNNKRHVACHVIRPVTDFNEISMHLLEATAVHLYFTRGPPESANGAVKAEGGMFVDAGYGGATNGGAAGGVGKKLPAKTSAMARKVYNHLQNAPQNNEGLHVHQIAAQLGIPANEVFKAGDELLGDGLIYTTVDDETWAVLEY